MNISKNKKNDNGLKIHQFINMLKASRQFIKYTSNNNEMLIFLEDFIFTLQPYKNIEAKNLLVELNETLKKYKIRSKITESILKNIDLKNIKLDELKELVLKKELKKADLLIIADISLGMPIGSLKSSKKDDIKNKILNMIDNFEKLDSIKKQAKL